MVRVGPRKSAVCKGPRKVLIPPNLPKRQFGKWSDLIKFCFHFYYVIKQTFCNLFSRQFDELQKAIYYALFWPNLIFKMIFPRC